MDRWGNGKDSSFTIFHYFIIQACKELLLPIQMEKDTNDHTYRNKKNPDKIITILFWEISSIYKEALMDSREKQAFHL